MKKAGELLRTARERKGYSLSYVAEKTKIKEKVLKALEEGEYEKLPSEVYIKGLIRTYAWFLGLNGENLLAFFRREYKREKEIPTSPPQPLSRPSIVITPRLLFGWIVSLTLIAFLGFLYWEYRLYAGVPTLLVEQPQDEIQIEQEFVEVVGRTDKDAQLFINGQPVNTNEGLFAIAVGLNPGLNILKIEARSKIGKKREVIRKIEVSLPEPKEEIAKEVEGKTLNLKVKIGPDSAWLKVIADGKEVCQKVLLPNTEGEFSAHQRMILKTGNAGSTQVWLNGEDLGKLGQENEVVEREFTP